MTANTSQNTGLIQTAQQFGTGMSQEGLQVLQQLMKFFQGSVPETAKQTVPQAIDIATGGLPGAGLGTSGKKVLQQLMSPREKGALEKAVNKNLSTQSQEFIAEKGVKEAQKLLDSQPVSDSNVSAGETAVSPVQSETSVPGKATQSEINGLIDGLPLRLMMMGQGLQGGNPMEVLSSLVKSKQLEQEIKGTDPKLLETVRQFDKEMTLKRDIFQAEIAKASSTAEIERAKLGLREIESYTAMVNAAKDMSLSFTGRKDSTKLMKTIHDIFGKRMEQLDKMKMGTTSASANSLSVENFDEKTALKAGYSQAEINAFKAKLKGKK